MPHNNTQQASKETTYMKPEDVDFTKPLKFEVCGTIYTYDPATTLTCNTESGWQDYCDFIVKDIMAGRSKVLAELKQPESTQETLFGASFLFECCGRKYLYSGKCEAILYPGSAFHSYLDKENAKLYIQSGYWKLLPSQAPQPPSIHADEASFTYAEQMVAEALAPAEKDIEQHSKQDWFGFFFEAKEPVRMINLPAKYFRHDATDEDKAVLEATRKLLDSINAPKPANLLDVIKNACTQSKGRIAVTVYNDHYEVYHRPMFEDCISVPEKDIVKFLNALLLIDSMETW